MCVLYFSPARPKCGHMAAVLKTTCRSLIVPGNTKLALVARAVKLQHFPVSDNGHVQSDDKGH